MDINVEVVTDDLDRRLFILFETGHFGQPLVLIDEFEAADVVAKFFGCTREEALDMRSAYTKN